MKDKYSSMLNQDAFNNIHPRKKELILEMLELMENKSSEQKLQIMLAYGMRMQNEGLQLTTNESQALMESLKNNLTTNETDKLDMMIKMMGMMK